MAPRIVRPKGVYLHMFGLQNSRTTARIPDAKDEALCQIDNILTSAVSYFQEGYLIKAKDAFIETRLFIQKCKRKLQIVLPEETDFFVDVLICYTFIKAYDIIEDKSCEEYKNEDFKVRTSIDVLACRYPKRHLPLILKLMYLFKKQCWRECLFYCAAARGFIIYPAIEKKYKTVPVFTKELIPELDIAYCNETIRNIEEASVYGLVEQLAKLDEIQKVNSPLVGLNWIKLWSPSVHEKIIRELHKLRKPVTPLQLHKIFHSEVLPRFYSLNTSGKAKEKSIYCYYNQKYLFDCEECSRAKLQEDSKNELLRSTGNPKILFKPVQADPSISEHEMNDYILETMDILEREILKSEREAEGKFSSGHMNLHSRNGEKIEQKSQQCQTTRIKVNSKLVQTEINTTKRKHIGVQTDYLKIPKEAKQGVITSECAKRTNDKIISLLDDIKKKMSTSNVDVKNYFTEEFASFANFLVEELDRKDSQSKIESNFKMKQIIDNLMNFENDKVKIQEKLCRDQVNLHENSLDMHKKEFAMTNADLKKYMIEQFSVFENILSDESRREKSLESEMKIMREKLESLEKEKVEMQQNFEKDRKDLMEKNVLLQKLLLDQVGEKYEIYKNCYVGIEKNCRSIMGNITELQNFLTHSTIPNIRDSQLYLNRWQKTLSDLQKKNEKLKAFYKKIKSEIQKDHWESGNWPELAEIPVEAFRFLFESLKHNIKIIIGSNHGSPFVPPQIVSMPQQCRSHFRCDPPYPPAGPPLVPGPPIPFETCFYPFPDINISNNDHSRFLNATSNDENRGAMGYGAAYSKNEMPTRIDVASQCGDNVIPKVTENIKKFEEDKEIYEFIWNRCPEIAEEDQLITIIIKTLKKYNGSFRNVARADILQEVKSVIRKEKLNSWPLPDTPIVYYGSDDTDPFCPICFDDFFGDEQYALPCKHEYHKKCITQWLKANSVCPICRVHSVIEEDIPASGQDGK